MKNLKTFETHSIIGRTEKVTITNNDGQSLTKDAKIDTGSYSSRISPEIAKELNLPVVDQREVKSATGEDDRTFVELQFNINGVEIKTQAGIANMDDLRNEVSIGRKDIETLDALVDVNKDNTKEIGIEVPSEEVSDVVIKNPNEELIKEPSDIMSFGAFNRNESLVKGGGNNERTIDLRGSDGNAYVILGYAKDLCNQLKNVDSEKYDWEKIEKEMTSSDYKNLVITFDNYFGDYVTIYNADVLDESKVNQNNGTKIHKFNDYKK